jgi:hypothetical protein
MAKITTKQRVLNYLATRGWVSGTELEDMSHEWLTKSSIIRRRTQELAHDGQIERRLSDKRTVQYMAKRYEPRIVTPVEVDQPKLLEVPTKKRMWI